MAMDAQAAEQAAVAWAALRAWLAADEAGRAVLARFEQDPGQEAGELAAWLDARRQQAPAPLATYVSGGSVGELINIATVGALNVAGAPQFNIQHATFQGAPPLTGTGPLRRNVFAPLLANRRELFAGRDDALAQLDALLQAGDSGYVVVTAPAGFGKTALMANFVAQRPHRTGYHFFTPLYGSSILSEGFFLRNVVEQMAQWQGYTNPLPEESDLNALRAHYQELGDAPPDPPAVLVLDGLDEVTWDLSPYLSRPLPAGLHVVATVRDVGQDWAQQYRLPAGQYAPLSLGGLSRDGVAAVLRQAGGKATRFADDPLLLDHVVRVAAYEAAPALGADPFYVRFLAEDAARGNLDPHDILSRPSGLGPYLDQWWEAIKGAAGEAPVRDLFGTLVVTLGPIERAALERINPSLVDSWAADRFDEVLAGVRRLVMRDAAGRYALAHPRLRQYLSTKLAAPALQGYREKVLTFCAEWDVHRSPYALRYHGQHLAATAAESQPPERGATIERLVGLVVSPTFQAAHQDALHDPAALQRDLEQALRCAAEEPGLSPALVIQAALALVSFRREGLGPEQVFQPAREGNLEEAERHLALLGSRVDANWYQALLLTIAWLAFDAAPESARALRQRLVDELPSTPGLDLLRARVAATMYGAPLPPLPLGDVPQRHEAEAIVARLSDKGIDASMMHEMMAELMHRQGGPELLSQQEYLAVQDAPDLVALAAAHPAVGDEYVRKYVEIHRTYPYVQYRNRSLWVVLAALLAHPDQQWVRERVAEAGAAALAPSVELQEGLGLAVLTLQVAAGEPGARAELDAAVAGALAGAAGLAPDQGQNDSWGAHKRRLAALAEALARTPALGLDPNPLVDAALNTPFGFAGYHAPACLTLAEAVEIVRPDDPYAVDRALSAALSAAHNVQDTTFCARTTARVHAMRARWWGLPPAGGELAGVVARLGQDPAAVEFTALHLVGDAYERRVEHTTLPIDALRAATTLRALAAVYERPPREFERVNEERGWALDEPLAGEHVNVPDAEFGPLLAARLAGLVLADGTLPDPERVRLIQSLVPLAAANPTALDTVLTRLVLAWRPTDPGVLAMLRQAIAQHVAPPPGDLALPNLPA